MPAYPKYIANRKDWLKIVLIVIGHLTIMLWALNLVAPPDNISIMWLPDGYLLGMLLLIEKRLYIPLLLVLVPSIFIFEYIYTGRSAIIIMTFLLANLIESYGAALLYSRTVKDKSKLNSWRFSQIFNIVYYNTTIN